VIHQSDAGCDSCAAQAEHGPQLGTHSSDLEPQGTGSAFSLAALSQGMAHNISMSALDPAQLAALQEQVCVVVWGGYCWPRSGWQ
jgi:hypothetical protein